jgi:hypothetical protein
MERIGPLRLRLARAEDHLRLLKAAIDSYMGTEPYEIYVQKDGSTGEGTVHIVERRPVPPVLSLVVGDTVHNLRSTLDHLTWQLAQLLGPPQFPERVVFPVCGYLDTPGKKSWRSVSKQALKEVIPAARPVFDDLQPYHQADAHVDHPLWLLNELWNFDKHRQLILVGSYMYDNRVDITSPTGTIEDVDEYRGAVAGDVVLASFRVSPPEAPVMFKGEHRFDVVFEKMGPVGERHAYNTLLDIHQFVSSRVIPAFEPFLS